MILEGGGTYIDTGWIDKNPPKSEKSQPSKEGKHSCFSNFCLLAAIVCYAVCEHHLNKKP